MPAFHLSSKGRPLPSELMDDNDPSGPACRPVPHSVQTEGLMVDRYNHSRLNTIAITSYPNELRQGFRSCKAG
jgi:hypothetical protein